MRKLHAIYRLSLPYQDKNTIRFNGCILYKEIPIQNTALLFVKINNLINFLYLDGSFSTSAAPHWIVLKCRQPMRGRYVTIQHYNVTSLAAYLSLCEVFFLAI